MKNFLLDTSVIIDFLRQKEKRKTLLYRLSEYELFSSIISHSEVFSGKSVWENEEARKTVQTVFSDITIIPLTQKLSEYAGYIKAHQSISLIDCIIAATAIQENIELVSLNTKDFKLIEGIRLYLE